MITSTKICTKIKKQKWTDRKMVKAKLSRQNHTKKPTHTHSQKEKEKNIYIYLYIYILKKEESNQINIQIYQ